MHNSDTETYNKYKIEDLPKFFKERSKNISKAFSSKIIKISTIRSRSIESNIQEFSFELTATGKDTFNTRPFQIKSLIDFFKICLSREKNFTVNIKVPKESSELYNNYCKTNSDKTVEEFVNNAPPQILLQGITIILQTNVKDINLDNLHQIGSFLNEKLKHAEKTENEEQSQVTLQVKEAEQNVGQTTSHTEYFKANRKKKSKKQTKELSEKEKQLAIKQAQNDARVAMIDNQIEHKGKKLDEIFVEVISEYKNQDPETFHNIFNSIFNIVYFQDKQLHEILGSSEISEVLEILEISQPVGKSFFPKGYLQEQVYRKKEQLVSGVYIQQPPMQHKNTPHKSTNPLPIKDPSPATNEAKTLPPTNITLKSPLKTVFSSKKAYFCLFIIVASASTLCLWHFPLGKVSMLKVLVPPEKRENIGLALNIGLPTLITLCVLSLAYFIYSEYSIESVKQVSKNDPLSRAYS
ncbi:hypothetical protein H9I48_01420 [Wolbachia pipientis]|uniref:hypothetical protein n=1 Tax=Wolbachia pipientis TaxID=955 RepID=UPI00165169EA|nr:hypothetical protein [Wolbachia pipientis]MBC6685917.1 hypothetical protein [Wolbachia pipientis]